MSLLKIKDQNGNVTEIVAIRGEKGEKGDTGAQGEKGADGTSVTVESVSESTADGGDNVITFSDGKVVTIKNGSKGSTGVQGDKGADGYTPQKGVDYFDGAKGDKGDKGDTGTKGADGYTPIKGVDYFTATDKAEIAQMVIESLGAVPVFGYVDENNNIIVRGNLADGTYYIKYEMEDGSTVDIGNLELASDTPEVSYTNLLPKAIDVNGNLFVGNNGEKGYITGYRLSSSDIDGMSTEEGAYCTGFIPIGLSDTFRIKNIAIHSNDTANRLYFYDSSKTLVHSINSFHINTALTINNDVYQGKPSSWTSDAVAYLRFSCGGITDETVVTVNEEIE